MIKFNWYYSNWDGKLSVSQKVAVSFDNATKKPKDVFGDHSYISAFPKDVYQDWMQSGNCKIADTLLYRRLMSGRVVFKNKHSIAVLVDGEGFAEPITSPMAIKRSLTDAEVCLLMAAKDILKERRIVEFQKLTNI